MEEVDTPNSRCFCCSEVRIMDENQNKNQINLSVRYQFTAELCKIKVFISNFVFFGTNDATTIHIHKDGHKIDYFCL